MNSKIPSRLLSGRGVRQIAKEPGDGRTHFIPHFLLDSPGCDTPKTNPPVAQAPESAELGRCGHGQVSDRKKLCYKKRCSGPDSQSEPKARH